LCIQGYCKTTDEEDAMKKTVKKLNLHRETLRGLTGGVYINQTQGTVTVPSCVDGCPSVMCPTTLTFQTLE
jgi:hypothetical protein